MAPTPRLMAVVGVLAQGALAATPEVRRETKASFAVDETFQADGGVQLYFEFFDAGASPLEQPALEYFKPLDRAGQLQGIGAPVHVVVARLSYLVEKDVGFFTRERLLDLDYVRAIAPEMDVTARPDGGFRVGRTPANDFTLEFFSEATALAPLAPGAPVVVQENFDFARVMGWRTGAWSATWTFHERVGPERTRVHALSLSYLHNAPPRLLGGPERLFNETRTHALSLISRLRDYSP